MLEGYLAYIELGREYQQLIKKKNRNIKILEREQYIEKTFEKYR
jgi:hypothetical protein